VFRGFNNVFSGSLLMINDYRFAGVPSLRVNTPYLIATTNEDVANVQFLLGPASALYGPNATSGVVHIISKSPFEAQGTTVALGGGERSTFRAGIRHAGAPTSRFGYKISGMLFRAKDWEYTDPAETLPRDFDIERWSGEIRADYAPSDNSKLILQAGRAEAGTALEMTGIGTAQANDWSNTYYQARFDWNRLFLQTFLNQSHTDNTRLLRAGQLIIDKSRVIAAQARHGFNLGSRQDFAYGADFQFTDPRTEGTINGRNEDDDKITEYGGFIQSETQLSSKLDFIASIRGDKNSRLDDPEFSPRAALVFKPQPGQTLRLTFNSAFATPTPNNLFLDVVAQRLSPQLPYFIRTLGVPREGFQFRRDCAGGKGGLCMRSPFAAPPGATVVPFMPTDVTLLWPVVRGLLAMQGIDTVGLGTPTAAQIPTRLRIVTAPGDTVTPSQVRDVERLKANLVRTYEVGYSGIVASRVQLTVDGYYETRRNFTGPLIIETPNAFFDAPALIGYLVSRGRTLAQAQAIATVIAPIPFGTVTPDHRLTQNADLMLTYRNFGKLKRWGADLGFEALLTPPVLGPEQSNEWTLYGSYSWVNKHLFPRSEVGGVSDVTLNAPKNKAALGVRFGQVPTGLSVDVRGRWADEFPMNSGVFIGTVESYTLVDATVAYRLPFAKSTTISVDATNILNEKHRELVGAPELGRLLLTQLQVTF
jgi:iron complex outermembrane receptor protein